VRWGLSFIRALELFAVPLPTGDQEPMDVNARFFFGAEKVKVAKERQLHLQNLDT